MTPSRFPAAVGAALAEAGASGRALVACSGGGDSLALLRACVELRDDGTPVEPIAAFFDHRQRDGSSADGDAVAERCKSWGCEFLRGQFDGPAGASEATLRTARYRWLAAAAAKTGFDTVLTGHTLDDQAETVLLRVVRGTGLAGLAGIPAIGPLPVPSGDGSAARVVRPLLSVTGSEARRFLTERGLTWREDPSNAELDFARNRLRHEVLPRLDALNPRVRDAVGRLADVARDEATANDELAAFALDGTLERCDAERIVLRAALYESFRPPGRTAILRAAWKRAGWPERRMGRREWRRLAEQRVGERFDLPHGVRAERDAERLTLRRSAAEADDCDDPAGG